MSGSSSKPNLRATNNNTALLSEATDSGKKKKTKSKTSNLVTVSPESQSEGEKISTTSVLSTTSNQEDADGSEGSSTLQMLGALVLLVCLCLALYCFGCCDDFEFCGGGGEEEGAPSASKKAPKTKEKPLDAKEADAGPNRDSSLASAPGEAAPGGAAGGQAAVGVTPNSANPNAKPNSESESPSSSGTSGDSSKTGTAGKKKVTARKTQSSYNFADYFDDELTKAFETKILGGGNGKNDKNQYPLTGVALQKRRAEVKKIRENGGVLLDSSTRDEDGDEEKDEKKGKKKKKKKSKKDSESESSASEEEDDDSLPSKLILPSNPNTPRLKTPIFSQWTDPDTKPSVKNLVMKNKMDVWLVKEPSMAKRARVELIWRAGKMHESSLLGGGISSSFEGGDSENGLTKTAKTSSKKTKKNKKNKDIDDNNEDFGKSVKNRPGLFKYMLKLFCLGYKTSAVREGKKKFKPLELLLAGDFVSCGPHLVQPASTEFAFSAESKKLPQLLASFVENFNKPYFLEKSKLNMAPEKMYHHLSTLNQITEEILAKDDGERETFLVHDLLRDAKHPSTLNPMRNWPSFFGLMEGGKFGGKSKKKSSSKKSKKKSKWGKIAEKLSGSKGKGKLTKEEANELLSLQKQMKKLWETFMAPSQVSVLIKSGDLSMGEMEIMAHENFGEFVKGGSSKDGESSKKFYKPKFGSDYLKSYNGFGYLLPSTGKKPLYYADPEKHTAKMLKIKSTNKFTEKVTFSWVNLDPLAHYHNSNPWAILTRLLNDHSLPTNPAWALKISKMLVRSYAAIDGGQLPYDTEQFSIDMHTTEKGLTDKGILEMGEYIFNHIAVIKKKLEESMGDGDEEEEGGSESEEGSKKGKKTKNKKDKKGKSKSKSSSSDDIPPGVQFVEAMQADMHRMAQLNFFHATPPILGTSMDQMSRILQREDSDSDSEWNVLPEDVLLDAYRVFKRVDKDLLLKLLEQLTVDNLQVIVMDPNLGESKQSKKGSKSKGKKGKKEDSEDSEDSAESESESEEDEKKSSLKESNFGGITIQHSGVKKLPSKWLKKWDGASAEKAKKKKIQAFHKKREGRNPFVPESGSLEGSGGGIKSSKKGKKEKKTSKKGKKKKKKGKSKDSESEDDDESESEADSSEDDDDDSNSSEDDDSNSSEDDDDDNNHPKKYSLQLKDPRKGSTSEKITFHIYHRQRLQNKDIPKAEIKLRVYSSTHMTTHLTAKESFKYDIYNRLHRGSIQGQFRGELAHAGKAAESKIEQCDLGEVLTLEAEGWTDNMGQLLSHSMERALEQPVGANDDEKGEEAFFNQALEEWEQRARELKADVSALLLQNHINLFLRRGRENVITAEETLQLTEKYREEEGLRMQIGNSAVNFLSAPGSELFVETLILGDVKKGAIKSLFKKSFIEVLKGVKIKKDLSDEDSSSDASVPLPTKIPPKPLYRQELGTHLKIRAKASSTKDLDALSQLVFQLNGCGAEAAIMHKIWSDHVEGLFDVAIGEKYIFSGAWAEQKGSQKGWKEVNSNECFTEVNLFVYQRVKSVDEIMNELEEFTYFLATKWFSKFYTKKEFDTARKSEKKFYENRAHATNKTDASAEYQISSAFDDDTRDLKHWESPDFMIDAAKSVKYEEFLEFAQKIRLDSSEGGASSLRILVDAPDEVNAGGKNSESEEGSGSDSSEGSESGSDADSDGSDSESSSSDSEDDVKKGRKKKRGKSKSKKDASESDSDSDGEDSGSEEDSDSDSASASESEEDDDDDSKKKKKKKNNKKKKSENSASTVSTTETFLKEFKKAKADKDAASDPSSLRSEATRIREEVDNKLYKGPEHFDFRGGGSDESTTISFAEIGNRLGELHGKGGVMRKVEEEHEIVMDDEDEEL